MGPFVRSYRNYYIFVAIDYNSNWADASVLPNSEAKSLTQFCKGYIFTKFVTPHTIIIDEGSYLWNQSFVFSY